MKLGEHSESLNKITNSLDPNKAQEIKNWWGKKIILSFTMWFLFGMIGVMIGWVANNMVCKP